MRGLPKRRRHEQKTDYKARLALLKSKKPRLVVRKSNKYLTAQIVQSDGAQDTVLVTANSKALLTKGWPKDKTGSLKNRAAGYLTGMLVAKLAASKKIEEAILDLGMYRNILKSRLYSVLKGAVDAGLKIAHNEKALPTEEMISSADESKLIDKIKDKL